MRTRLTWAITVLSVVLLAPVAGAVTEAEVQADIDTFQGYFKKRFPNVALVDYADGVNALPAYSERRANWELLMEFPPFEPEMEKARKEWSKPFANGKSLADCDLRRPTPTLFMTRVATIFGL